MKQNNTAVLESQADVKVTVGLDHQPGLTIVAKVGGEIYRYAKTQLKRRVNK
jgi:hypothetical protein